MSKDYKKTVLQADMDDVYQALQESKGRFLAVSDMADNLKLSLSRTLDILVALRNENRAVQNVGGWESI